MKAADDFIFKKTSEVGVILPVGERRDKFCGVVTLNETGSLLWEKLQSGSDREELINALLCGYEVDRTTAAEDVDKFINKLRSAGLILD